MFPKPRGLRLAVILMWMALISLAVASPAAAQWSRVVDVPQSPVFAVRVNGDTIAVGTSTTVFVSTNAGVSWKESTKPVANVGAITAVLVLNGRLYAGTFGQGVFVSDDLGDTWQSFNQGLVGGFLDSQLDVDDLTVRGDSVYAATAGAGAYVRRLTGPSTWSHFGEIFEPDQASNLNVIATDGTRLLAAGGSNGTVFFRDPGQAEWTQSFLSNADLLPGVQARSVVWNGHSWVVGTESGLFRSTLGQEPWTFVNLGLGGLNNSAFATRGRHLFAAFSIPTGAVIAHSGNDGATWQQLEFLSNVFVFQMAGIGDKVYTGRLDGLWRRSTDTVSVPPTAGAPTGLSFALASAQPVGNDVRFRFELPEAGNTSLDVFDVAGRRATDSIQQAMSAGPHEVSLDASQLGAGVYAARLTAGGRQEVVRLIHVR